MRKKISCSVGVNTMLHELGIFARLSFFGCGAAMHHCADVLWPGIPLFPGAASRFRNALADSVTAAQAYLNRSPAEDASDSASEDDAEPDAQVHDAEPDAA